MYVCFPTKLSKIILQKEAIYISLLMTRSTTQPLKTLMCFYLSLGSTGSFLWFEMKK